MLLCVFACGARQIRPVVEASLTQTGSRETLNWADSGAVKVQRYSEVLEELTRTR